MKPMLAFLPLAATLACLCLISPEANEPLSAGEKKDAPKPTPRPRRGPVKLTEEALRIHREAILIDGHNDLPWQFREKADLSFRKIDLYRPQKGLHTDIP